MTEIIKEQVEKALGDIRPALQADGGDIELVDVLDDGVVQVRLQGAVSYTHLTLPTILLV